MSSATAAPYEPTCAQIKEITGVRWLMHRVWSL